MDAGSLASRPQVHLQIYDGVCHDLPLFSFTTPAKYCFRAMASFAKWVTTPPGRSASTVVPDGMELPVEKDPLHPDAAGLRARPPPSRAASLMSSIRGDSARGSSTPTSRSRAPKKQRSLPQIRDLEKTIYTSTQPFNRPEYVNNMIRERISVTGVVRPMEPESEMSMLQLDKEDLGVIKEAPVKRYLDGSACYLRWYTRTLADSCNLLQRPYSIGGSEARTRRSRNSARVRLAGTPRLDLYL